MAGDKTKMDRLLERVTKLINTIEEIDNPELFDALSRGIDKLQSKVNALGSGSEAKKEHRKPNVSNFKNTLNKLKDRLTIINPKNYDSLESRINILVAKVVESFNNSYRSNRISEAQKSIYIQELQSILDGSNKSFNMDVLRERFNDWYYKVVDEMEIDG